MTKINQSSSVDWYAELNAMAFKYHTIIAWVAVVLNPIWGIADYYTTSEHFISFLVFRIVVSLLTLFVLLVKNKFINRPHVIAFVPFLGISIQNAYMYSMLDIAELQKHTFAYIALFIGAGMFVLWRTSYTIITVIISFVANIIFFSIYGHLEIADVLINGGMLTLSVALFTILLIYTRTNLTKREIIARLELAESKHQLEIKNQIIEEKSKDIRDSINYAQRIQQAVLPPFEKIADTLKDYFVFFKPKDIVSGDFYWYANVNTTPREGRPSENISVMAAIDCTGHGVPGALMSIIGGAILNQTTTDPAVNSPGDALNYLNKGIIKTLNSIKDGMDMSLCAINFSTMKLQYAGANNPIYIIRNKQLIEIKPDKQAIGADSEVAEVKIFTNHIFDLQKGDSIYLFTDGYADQFGGPSGKKFKYKQFQELLLNAQEYPMETQQKIIETAFESWKGELEQVDDVLVIGIRI